MIELVQRIGWVRFKTGFSIGTSVVSFYFKER